MAAGAVAGGVAGLFGIGSSVVGGILGSNSQRDAQHATERSVTNTNASNLILDLIARGGTIPASIGSGRNKINFPASLVGQSSAVLPYYFGGAESGLGNAATDLFNASYGLDSTRTSVPTSSLARYANPITGAQNLARDQNLLRQLKAQQASGGRNAFGGVDKDLVNRIATLESRLKAATPNAERSGINPGIGQAIADQVRQYQQQIGEFQPAFEQGNELINNVASGGVTDQMLAEAKPVQDARIQLANMEKDAGISALQDKLNEIKAIQQRKGYSGDSTASQRLEFDARRRIGTDAARAIGGANLTNAQQTEQIQGAGRDLQLRSLDLPVNRAKQSVDLSNLPANAAQQRFQAALAPFQFFRTGPPQLNVAGQPPVSSVPSTGQILATAGGRVGELASAGFLNNWGRPRGINRPDPSFDVAANGSYLQPGTFDFSADYGYGPGGNP